MSFVEELKRRNVLRIALAYLAGSWLLIQVADTVFPAYGLPESALTILITVLGIGFIPTVVLAWVFELTPQGLKRDTDVDRSTPAVATRNFDRVLIALLVVAIAYFAVDKFVIGEARIEEATQQGRIRALVESYGDKSIAVLPFVNMSSDLEQEYFSDGISEELLNLLAKVRELRVISRSSAFSFKGKDVNIQTIARELDVAHILEGSVRRSGDTIRITAQLIDARTDTHMWSETYDRKFDNIFFIQDEIAAAVVEELKITLLGDAPVTRKGDAEAYALYLRAVQLLNGIDEEKTRQAGVLLQEVLRRDPTDVRAMGQLARVIARSEEPGSQERARELVDEILAIDPDYAFANGWLAWFAFNYDNDLEASARHLERALILGNSDLEVLRGLLQLIFSVGRREEAVAIAEYVVARSPLCAQCQYSLARFYRLTGRLYDAEAALRAALILLPEHGYLPLYRDLGRVLLFQSRPEEALQAFERQQSGQGKNQGKAMAYYDLGRQAEFESALQELKEDFAEEQQSTVAYVYARIGDNDAALEWLAKDVEWDKASLARELEYYVYRNLRDDPRFIALQELVGTSPEQLAQINLQVTLPPGITIN